MFLLNLTFNKSKIKFTNIFEVCQVSRVKIEVITSGENIEVKKHHLSKVWN